MSRKWLGIIFLLFSLQNNSIFPNKYYLSVCAIFRDEARFLKEWIEFHRLVGVEHFYLLNNQSTDDYQKILEPYTTKGIVDLYQWNYTLNDFKCWPQMQRAAYNKIFKEHGHETKWMAVIDTDEFLFPVKKNTLPEFLKEYEEFGGVCANMVMFGTNHVKRIPKNKLLIETLISKGAHKNYRRRKDVKGIVQPRYIKQYRVHFGIFNDPEKHFTVTENKERSPKVRSPSFSVNKIRINHYWTRDEDFLHNTKIVRAREMKMPGSPPTNKMIQWNRDFNRVKDYEIFRFLNPLRQQMSQS